MMSTNPFEDESNIPGITSTNPFDDENDEEENDSSKERYMINPNEDVRLSSSPSSASSSSSTTSSNQNLPLAPTTTSTSVLEQNEWNYLGDIPYRKIPLYKNIKWEKITHNPISPHSLPSFPLSWFNSGKQLPQEEIHNLILSSTITKVTACPYGGPIACITIPLSSMTCMSELRVLSNHGTLISSIPFPPIEYTSTKSARIYSAADIFEIGFTNRNELIVLLRDSLCFVYNLQLELLLTPFFILKNIAGGASMIELISCHVFDSGVAVLSETMSVALVELLSTTEDDPTYANEAYKSCRFVYKEPKNLLIAKGATSKSGGGNVRFISGTTSDIYALITPINSSSSYANEHQLSYCCIAVLSRFFTASHHPEVFLSTSDHSVVIVNSQNMEFIDVNCRSRLNAPILLMSFAPNGRFLACFTSDSILTVISTTFETKVLDFDTSEGSSAPPKHMKWCGEDSVVLHWKNLGVLMVGPYGDWLRFPMEDEDIYIINEMDSCRVISSSHVELIQRVPPMTADLLRIGSIDDGALLLDASDLFHVEQQQEAEVVLKEMKELDSAIETLAEAASMEFHVDMQKRLLRGASYGMHFSFKNAMEQNIYMGGDFTLFLEDYNHLQENVRPNATALKFVSIAKKIRILNALRNIGIPMTSTQFDHVTPKGVIARLVEYRRPALACLLAEFLRVDVMVQVMTRAARAASFVSSSKEDDVDILEQATSMLHQESHSLQNKNIPLVLQNWGAYAYVAHAAYKASKPSVASLLLRMEPSIEDKCAVLISMGLYADAASVASSVYHLNLIFLSLLEFQKNSLEQDSFVSSVVSKFPADAVALLSLYYMSLEDIKPLLNLLLKSQRYLEAGCFLINRAFSLSTLNQQDESNNLLKESSRIFGISKECQFQKSCVDDHLELINEQQRLQDLYNTPQIEFRDNQASITDTLSSIIMHAAKLPTEAYKIFQEADKFAKKFRLTDKRTWHIKVQALSASSQWAQLRMLADSHRTKPPIGYKPFARACIKYNQPAVEITRYIERITTSNEDRFELFVEAKLWKRALDEALKLKDASRIEYIKSICGAANAEVIGLCDDILKRI